LVLGDAFISPCMTWVWQLANHWKSQPQIPLTIHQPPH
jgi:hypothetical protein